MRGGGHDLRRLGARDVALARQLNVMFGEAFGEPDTYADDANAESNLPALLAKEHVIALVALAEGEVVGGLVAYELDKLERGRREVYIYDLAVAEGHRRRGIATALIELCRAIAAERGAWVLYVQADYEDAPAVALYEKMGRREDVLHFDIPVEAPNG
jgi:aminoglycoside 3-N-acetyltransferase I